MNHNLSNEELRAQMDEEARAAEAAARDEDDGAPLPEHVNVSRPNRENRLQVRLSPDEMNALEAIAARRGMKVSTFAREQLLVLIDREQASAAGDIVNWTVKLALNQLADLALSIRDAADSDAPQLIESKLVRVLPLVRAESDSAPTG